jgi:hypothetical protein
VEKVASGQWPMASKSEMSSLSTSHKPLATSSNPQSLVPNPSLSTLYSSLFTVTTPSATITDLGTEFGVDVEKNGACEVHVLQGLVQAQFSGSSGDKPQTVQLKEGEGRRYQRQGNQLVDIPVDRAKFQQMPIDNRPTNRHARWLEYSEQLRNDPALTVYYTFERAGKDNCVLPNMARTGSALDGRVEGAEWVYGRLPGKFALYFRGPGSGNRVVLPEQDRFNFTGPFSVAVWFKVEQLTMEFQRLVVKGDTTWRLQRDEVRSGFAFVTNHLGSAQTDYRAIKSQTDVVDGRWHLGVAVYEPVGKAANMRLYMDGHLEGEVKTSAPLNRDDNPVCLGGIIREKYDRTFCGRIDEVAIFARALAANEVAEMFNAGNPAGVLRGRSDKNK